MEAKNIKNKKIRQWTVTRNAALLLLHPSTEAPETIKYRSRRYLEMWGSWTGTGCLSTFLGAFAATLSVFSRHWRDAPDQLLQQCICGTFSLVGLPAAADDDEKWFVFYLKPENRKMEQLSTASSVTFVGLQLYYPRKSSTSLGIKILVLLFGSPASRKAYLGHPCPDKQQLAKPPAKDAVSFAKRLSL